MNNWLELIPEPQRSVAREAALSAFGSVPIDSIEAVYGGVSGALTYRVGAKDRFYLVRLETRRGPLRNPHQYACMRAAADAGIAPPLRYADDAAGVAIMDFVAAQPITDFPGGTAALAGALGELLAKLHATTPFPAIGDYRVFLDRMLQYVKTLYAPGLLDPHLEALARIRAAYPWDPSTHVSSHNDPNPRNILFDGARLWLIDWETSNRNDPLVDVAIVTENYAATPELEEILLRVWRGQPSDRALRARLRLVRQLTRLYYVGLLALSPEKPSLPIADLAAPTPDEFRAMISRGELKPTAIETRIVLGKMLLAGVLADVRADDFEETLKVAQNG